MSAAIKMAKANYQGDPGLFGFLGNIAKGALGIATGGASTALLGAAQTILGGAKKSSPSILVTSRPSAGTVLTAGSIPALPARPGIIAGADSVVSRGVTLGPLNIGSQTVYGPTAQIAPAGPAPRGKHLNKTGYFLKGGQYVAPGSRWVSNRRRNPLNPRALSRSMARLTSAKKAASGMARISIRDRKCGCRS